MRETSMPWRESTGEGIGGMMGGPEWRRRRKQSQCFLYPIRPIAQVGTNEQAATAYAQAHAQDA